MGAAGEASEAAIAAGEVRGLRGGGERGRGRQGVGSRGGGGDFGGSAAECLASLNRSFVSGIHSFLTRPYG